ncbi:hypothetical protein [Acinetobacter colistiniresistens]|uniref:Protein ActB n=1 Tax=Acinetobacter colistiniresistens TaxID=280145 RepID=S3TDW6_9GAMM|nr:hypothetical protein [Acinetobacter colistiniresistens]EPG37899.1 hypothetical protein F907_01869 [Acinetobacter colistiniresistens]TVT83626.1 hypothetical protein FPV60_07105 [Acinetobacter colistiniresistens]
MSLSINEVHILDMRFEAHVSVAEFKQWLAHIQQYFEQKRSFVLIMQTELDTEFPEEYREIQGKWYKQYKQDFYQYCLGLARIAQDEADRIRLDTPALQKAWHVPYFVSLEKTAAMQWAMQRYL